jgi:hypothetical protein
LTVAKVSEESESLAFIYVITLASVQCPFFATYLTAQSIYLQETWNSGGCMETQYMEKYVEKQSAW